MVQSRLPAAPAPEFDVETLKSAFLAASHAAKARDDAASATALAEARAALGRGLSGLAEAASLVSAFELPELPPLAKLPDALWGPCFTWLLAFPAQPPPGRAEALGKHLVRRYEELAGWMERNLAAPAVREAADAYLASSPPPLETLRTPERVAVQRARGRILRRVLGAAALETRPARARASRALRLGLLHARLDREAATFATLARCALLDPRRIEVHIVTFEEPEAALRARLEAGAATVHLLPEALAARIHALRSLDLDCLLFADELSPHPQPLAQLASLRMAPLQLAFGPRTTGLAGIDLLVAGELDSPAPQPRDCLERLALLPGCSAAWDCSVDRPADCPPVSRALLGFAEDQPLLLASAPVSPDHEKLARWRRLLAETPHATLLLIPEPGRETAESIRSFIYSAALPNLVLHEAPADHAALASLLALGDLGIDLSGPAAALALETGLPLILMAGQAEAALLRVAGLGENILPDADARLAELHHLLAHREALAARRARVGAAMETLPRFADHYALAADFAALLEHAHDELVSRGPGRFRRDRAPLRLATPHSLHPGDLHAEGLALLAEARPERAVPCLLSALQRAGADPALWFDLARAYRAAGQALPAIESLEACLRLHEGNAAAWRLLCELAAEAGNHDLAREALGIAASLAAEHPELAALRARLDA